jgi:hypothetical protein
MQTRVPKHVLVTLGVVILVIATVVSYRVLRPVPPSVEVSGVSWNVDGTTCAVSFNARNAGNEGVNCTFRIKPYHMPKGSRMVVGLGRRDITMFIEPGKSTGITQDVRIEVAPRNQTPVTGVDIDTL